jgi:hypothetical protein
MKKLLHVLIRFYPRSWRDRYEAELSALLDQSPPQPAHAFDLLKGALTMQIRRGNIALTPLAFGLAGAALTVAALSLIPRPFESRAVVSVRTTGNLAADTLIQSTLTSAELRRMVDEFHLYPGNSDPVEKLRDSISTAPLYRGGANAFELKVRDSDPVLARTLTRDLVARVIDGNIRRRMAEIEEEARRTGQPPAPLERKGQTVELMSPATLPTMPLGPNRAVSLGILAASFAESLQLGLIFVLLRRKAGYTPQQ